MNYLFAAVLFGWGSYVVLLQPHGVRGLHLTVKRPSSELRTVDKVSNLAFSDQWHKVGIYKFSMKWTIHELQTICCKRFWVATGYWQLCFWGQFAPGSISQEKLILSKGPDGNKAELTSKPLEKRKWNHVQGEEGAAVSSCWDIIVAVVWASRGLIWNTYSREDTQKQIRRGGEDYIFHLSLEGLCVLWEELMEAEQRMFRGSLLKLPTSQPAPVLSVPLWVFRS